MTTPFNPNQQHSDIEPSHSNNPGLDIESPVPFAYGTFGSNAAGSIPSGGEHTILNPFGQNNNNNNGNNTSVVLLSPSYSRKSGSAYSNGIPYSFTAASRGKMQPLELQKNRFLPISKKLIVYLTFICCLLFANMAQMIILYNLLSAENDKKEILIYIIFPFICFLCLKMNDLNLCNEIGNLFNFGYENTPAILNRKREIIHLFTFIGFPMLWIAFAVINSDWIQSSSFNVNHKVVNSILITSWTVIQFIQFNLCIICLIYCIQHNVHRQKPKDTPCTQGFASFLGKYSMTMTNSFNKNKAINGYKERVSVLQNQISVLQTQLIKSKHHNITTNSQLTSEYAEEIQEKDQEFRALLSERDLFKTECENKKSLLNIKKQQIKQQQFTIKSLQQIREENIQTINDLRKKLNDSTKEFQKVQLMLQIERQNVQNAHQYFENFT